MAKIQWRQHVYRHRTNAPLTQSNCTHLHDSARRKNRREQTVELSFLFSSFSLPKSPAYCNFGPKGSLQVWHSPSAPGKALGQRPRFVGPFQSSTQIGDAKLQPWLPSTYACPLLKESWSLKLNLEWKWIKSHGTPHAFYLNIKVLLNGSLRSFEV